MIEKSSESIPASSKVFWNRFRILGPESVSGTDSKSNSAPELVSKSVPESKSDPETELGPKSESTSK